MPGIIETFDFRYEERLFLPNRLTELNTGKTHIVTNIEATHFESFIIQISKASLNEIQKVALINMALDHLGWAKKLPENLGQTNFFRTTFRKWQEIYAPAAVHVCRGQGGYLSTGIVVDDVVFEDQRYTFRRGKALVSIADMQGSSTDVVSFELQFLDYVLSLLNSIPTLMMRHIPLMSYKFHAMFCEAITNRDEQIYHDLFSLGADVMIIKLADDVAMADLNLFLRRW